MKVKKILVSQPEPADLEKSPYRNLVTKYGVEITFYKFFEVVGLPVSEFRKTRIHLAEYTAIIFNSKNSVDHFFRLAKELREVIPDSMKYFCASEAIAHYLQNYIQYRKRKIFYGNQYFADLIEILSKHREEKFLFPCSDEKQTEYTKLLDKAKFKYTKATMYTSVPRDLSQFNLKDYDLICLFSPIGVRSLVKNFPNVAEENVAIAAFGTSTHAALKAAGILEGEDPEDHPLNIRKDQYDSQMAQEEIIEPTVTLPAFKAQELEALCNEKGLVPWRPWHYYHNKKD